MLVLGIFAIRIFATSSFATQLIGYKAVLPLKDKITRKNFLRVIKKDKMKQEKLLKI